MSSTVEENRLFQLIIFIVFLLTLFYGSDFMAIWETEAKLSLGALNNLSNETWFNFTKGYSPLSELMISGGLSTVGLTEWGARISSLIILAASFFSFYKLGNKIFTAKASLITIFLAMGSFPLLLIGKVATTDIWLFGLELLIFPLVIYQLKQPNLKRSISIVILSSLLVFIQPLSAVIFNTLLFGTLIFLHKSGKQLIKEAIVVSLISLTSIFIFKFNWVNEGFLFSFNHNLVAYLAFTFIGLISAFGFIPAVFMNLFQRIKIKEELAILTLAGLLAGLFSISFFAHFILLFLVGKQLSLVDNKNYPYLNSVKAFTIFQVLFAFFVAFLFIMNGFAWFQGTGFRKGLIFGIPIWGMGIYSLVAIFSKNKKHIIISTIFTGIIINFLFWTQIMPLWEAERNVYKDIASYVENDKKENTIYFPSELSDISEVEFYNKTIIKEDSITTLKPKELNNQIIELIKRDSSELSKGKLEIKSFQGRKYPWLKMEKYSLVK